MVKIRTTITINKDLLKKAKEHNISISSFLDIELRRYIALIEGKQSNSTSSLILNKKSSAGAGNRTRAVSLEGSNHNP